MTTQIINDLSTGKRLALLRKKNGQTQTELAKLLNVSRTTVTDYENDRIHMNEKTLIKIALCLQTSVDGLLGLKESQDFKEDQSLRIMKRLKKIELLSIAKQKVLLHTIDSFLRGEGI